MAQRWLLLSWVTSLLTNSSAQTNSPNAITANDRLDRKKDLWNNRIGRAIGVRVSQMGLAGSDAKHRIMLECVLTVEEDPQFLGHYLDNRVLMLSERKLGCLFLPRYNVFNLLLQTF
jgi:hypothetical protein